MNLLVYVEHDGVHVRSATLSALGFAQAVAAATGGDQPRLLVVGDQIDAVVADAAKYGEVLVVQSPSLAPATAEVLAPILSAAVREGTFDVLVAASTSVAKDVVGRAAGRLGGAMASDVVAHAVVDGCLHLDRPIHAGAAIATVKLLGSPQVVTVRSSAYLAAVASEPSFPVTSLSLENVGLQRLVEIIDIQSTCHARPDVTEASVVVSGGRAFKNHDDFERLVGGLADVLAGAAGSSRALVDAGITPNELQVGQTGKIVAPELYIALGISGAVQHLAGMKNSRTVVAVNSDPEAPIFDEADFGLVGDVYEVVPELIEKLQNLG
jgi:electron transfer flavoprotein alpha subunit